MNGKAPITAESLEQATSCIDELAEALCGLVEDNLGFSKFEKERSLLLAIMREWVSAQGKTHSAEERAMPHSLLLRRSKMPVHQFRSVMETLVESGDVRNHSLYGEAGRKSHAYLLENK